MTELPRPGALIAGRYLIESLLGQGAMGAVFAARDTTTGRAVALKWPAPVAAQSADAVLRFMAEARAIGRIEHPNVIAVIDVGREGHSPFLVMERLRGESLGERLKRGPLDVVSALDIVIAASRGVAEAHAEGVIHRDLKPDNIFLCETSDGPPSPKVLDFGLAKLREGQPLTSITKTGAVLGTPAYMSPEQIGAPREADARFDVYSMGVVLYEALTGRIPYEADDLLVLVGKIAAGEPATVRSHAPDVPAALDAIVRKAMSADREERYATMPALIAALEAVRMGCADTMAAMVRPLAALPSSCQAPAPEHGARAPESRSVRSPPRASPAVMAQRAPEPRRPPPRRFGALLLILGALAATALVAAVAIGGGLAWRIHARGGRTGAGGGEVTAPSTEPRRSPVELEFGGACRPSFDARVLVANAQAGGLTISNLAREDVTASIGLIVPLGLPVQGALGAREAGEMGISVAVWDTVNHRDAWMNTRSRADSPTAIGGTLIFHRWSPGRGRAFVVFDDVTLERSDGSICTIRGEIQTRGLTPARSEQGE